MIDKRMIDNGKTACDIEIKKVCGHPQICKVDKLNL